MALCKFCEIADWSDPRFLSLASAIMGGDAVRHRKLWEFTQTLKALEEFNLCDERANVLSVAAGTERVLYYLANRIRRVIATDIYGLSSFAYREATTSFLSAPEEFAPYPYRRDHLVPMAMDALLLRFPGESMDAVFSLSSIEHFGGMRAAARSLAEMRRVLKPGGIAIVVTDCSLNGRGTDQVFTRSDIESLIAGSGLSLAEPVDWSVSPETLRHLADMRRDDLGALPHINLRIFSSIFTSLCVVLRKSGEHRFSDPVSFDAMLSEIAAMPLQRATEESSTWDRLRARSRCFQRRVERKFEVLCGVDDTAAVAVRDRSTGAPVEGTPP